MKYEVWFRKGSGTPFDKVYHVFVQAANQTEAEAQIKREYVDVYGVTAYLVEEENSNEHDTH